MLPIVGIVLILCFTIVPIKPSILKAFMIGAVLLVAGMTFFTLGAELAMTPMGELIGKRITKTRSLCVMIVLGFIRGLIITISEPDLLVLANQVPSFSNPVLIAAAAVGVGVFLVFALLRMLFRIPLSSMLVFFYIIVFAHAFSCRKTFSR